MGALNGLFHVFKGHVWQHVGSKLLETLTVFCVLDFQIALSLGSCLDLVIEMDFVIFIEVNPALKW